MNRVPRPSRPAASAAGIAAAFLLGAAAGLGVLGAWEGAARAPTAAAVERAALRAARRIDINTADAAELALLPRIGPAIAQRIVDHRAARGRFNSLDDLEAVKGIGPRTIARLRPMAFASSVSISSQDRSEPAAR